MAPGPGSHSPSGDIPPVGVVLAGGRSTRMGRDKATITYKGRSLVSHVLGRLAKHCRPLMAVTDRPVRLAGLSCLVVGDLTPGRGPLGGLQAACHHQPGRWLVLAACDAPLIEPGLIDLMINEARPGVDVVACFWDGWVKPMPLVVAPGVRTRVDLRLEAGANHLRSIFQKNRMRVIGEDEVRKVDPEGRSFINLNTPADLALLDEN